MNKLLKFWIKNARDIALPQSIIPSLLAIAMAAMTTRFFMVAVTHCSCLELVVHTSDLILLTTISIINTTMREARKKVTAEGFRTHMKKCHYIESGKAIN